MKNRYTLKAKSHGSTPMPHGDFATINAAFATVAFIERHTPNAYVELYAGERLIWDSKTGNHI